MSVASTSSTSGPEFPFRCALYCIHFALKSRLGAVPASLSVIRVAPMRYLLGHARRSAGVACYPPRFCSPNLEEGQRQTSPARWGRHRDVIRGGNRLSPRITAMLQFR